MGRDHAASRRSGWAPLEPSGGRAERVGDHHHPQPGLLAVVWSRWTRSAGHGGGRRRRGDARTSLPYRRDPMTPRARPQRHSLGPGSPSSCPSMNTAATRAGAGRPPPPALSADALRWENHVESAVLARERDSGGPPFGAAVPPRHRADPDSSRPRRSDLAAGARMRQTIAARSGDGAASPRPSGVPTLDSLRERPGLPAAYRLRSCRSCHATAT